MNTPLNKLGAVVSLREAATSAEVFSDVARFMLISDGAGDAAATAEGQGRKRAAAILKSAVVAGSIADPAWAGVWADYDAVAAAWLDSIRSQSAFDTMLPSMIQVPLRTRVGITTTGATGYVRGEGGSPRRLSRMDLGAAGLDALSAVAWITVTRDLSKFAGPTGAALFDRELKAAVAAVTDQAFIAVLIDGITPTPSSGETTAAVRGDLATALAGIDADFRSKFFVLTTSEIAKSWATSCTESGAAAFPDMGPNGGTICKMPAIVSSGVPDGYVIVVDAAGIAAASENIELKVLHHATVDVGSPPDSPPTAATVLVSLYQENLVGLAAERYFGVRRMRTSAVGVISDVSDDSPEV
jgi:hypothetical protein